MISTTFDIAMASVPIPLPLLTAFVRRDVVGVLYHCISDEPVPHLEGVMPIKSISQFESDLLALKSSFNLVSYEEVVARRERNIPLPPRSVLLTIDDGFANAYNVIRPMLKKHNVPAVFFVITDTIDNMMMADTHIKGLCTYCMTTMGAEKSLDLFREHIREAPGEPRQFRNWFDGLTFRQKPYLDLVCDLVGANVESYLADHRPYMTSKEIRLLSDEGFTIGAHSRTHRELWLLTEREELEREIAQSCAVICELTGKESAPFSFPYQSNHIPRSLLAQIRERHPHVGLMFDTHGFRRDKDFVVARQCFDSPLGAAPAGSNLSLAMRHAYLAQLFWSMRGRGAIR